MLMRETHFLFFFYSNEESSKDVTYNKKDGLKWEQFTYLLAFFLYHDIGVAANLSAINMITASS